MFTVLPGADSTDQTVYDCKHEAVEYLFVDA